MHAMQQASCLEDGSLVWMLALYLHINQKSGDDDFMWIICYIKISLHLKAV